MMAAAAMLGGTASAENQPARVPVYDVPDGEANIFGYLRYDVKYRTYGIMNFMTNAPDDYRLTKNYGTVVGQTPAFMAGTYVGNDYLVFETTLYQNVFMPRAFSVVDPLTGEITTKCEIQMGDELLILDEMTYDPKTDRIFGISYETQDDWATDIYEISRTTYAMTKVATIDRPLYTLSADNGYLYGIAPNNNMMTKTMLVRIPQSSIDASKLSCSVEEVSPSTGTGVVIGDWSQSMEFDKTTHRLWWLAQTSDGKSTLVELDANTGVALSRTTVKNDPQMLSMAIPYQFVADEAPSYVTGFSAVAGQNGALNAQLNWTTPTKDYRNNALASLSGVRVYRNGTLVHSQETSTTGTAGAWTDGNAPEGLHVYRVAAYNTTGEGIYKEASVFVGEDVPGAPLNVKLSTKGSTATVTWDAPEAGAHNGYFNAATLSYDVVRMPDHVQVATGVTDKKITDQVVEHAGYSYVVTAKTSKGEGLSATSNTIAFGKSEGVPFTSKLDTKNDFDRWTIINNNNDEQTWKFRPTDEAQADYRRSCAMYDRSTEAADDWMVSPPMQFDAKKTYQLRYTYATTNWVNESTIEPLMENMAVMFGHKAEVSELNQVVHDPGEFHTASGGVLYAKQNFQVDESGEGFIAFKAYSKPWLGQIYLNDVSLREYSETDLSVPELRGSVTASRNAQQYYMAIVRNEGSKRVDNYEVQLIDSVTGDVLSTAKGISVDADTTVNVVLAWTPQEEGEARLQARVQLQGDTYPADNFSANTLHVAVTEEAEATWMTINSYNNYGWMAPFYVASPYSQTQCLYLEEEIIHTGIDITALRFRYDGHLDGSFSFPATIAMKTTDRTRMSLADNPYRGEFDTDGFSTVFEGDVTISGSEEGETLEIRFDNPFTYNGGNLLMRFVANCGGNLLNSDTHPSWHYSLVSGDNRCARTDGNDDQGDIWASEYVPLLMLEYKTSTGIGTIALGNGAQMAVSQQGGSLVLPVECDNISLYNKVGALVRTATNASSVSVNGVPAGLYIVKATANGKEMAQKVVLK